jgi:thiol-disulfide isomerase/thioredoxin
MIRLLIVAAGSGPVRHLMLVWTVLACFASMSEGSASDVWGTNYEAALAEAVRTGRPVLALFTGSDWCPHCKTLENNVFATARFTDWAEANVVLLMIDLPEEGISAAERSERSRVCLRYGVRTFPSVLLLDEAGQKIAANSGYRGQSAAAWIAAMDQHVEPLRRVRIADATAAPPDHSDQVLTNLDVAVSRALGTKRPILLVISGSNRVATAVQSASLVKDPEFEAVALEHFVVATVPAETPSLEGLLGGSLEPDAVEVIVTDDGKTPLFMASGSQSPQRIVSGLRRFLAARQASRQPTTRR